MSEILGTLFKYLLALLAITAVVAILYEALSSNKVSTAAAQITTLQANINQLYAGTSAGPSGLSNTTLTEANEIPSGMPVSGSTISNSWGGTVTIQADTGASLTGDADIIYTSVPQEACNKLSLALLPSMTQITINSADAIAAGDKTAVTAVAAACAKSSNSITFTFPVS